MADDTPIPEDLTAWMDDAPEPDPAPAGEGSAPPAGGEPDPTPTGTEQADQPQGDAGQTPDPAAPPAGDQTTPTTPPQRHVPVSEHMQMRQRAQAAEEAKAKADAEAKELANRAEYFRILATQGQEAATAFAEKVDADLKAEELVRETQSKAQQDADARVTFERLRMAANMARKAYGEAAPGVSRFDAAYDRLCEKFGADWVEWKASQAEDPGSWVIEFHDKELAPDPAAAKAAEEKRIEAEVTRRLEERLALQKTPSNTPDPSAFAQAGGASPNSEPSWVGKDPDEMTAKELREATAAAEAKARAKAG